MPTDIASARLDRARRWAEALKAHGATSELVQLIQDWPGIAEEAGEPPPDQSTIDLIAALLAVDTCMCQTLPADHEWACPKSDSWNGSPGTQTPPLQTDSGSRSDLDWSVPS